MASPRSAFQLASQRFLQNGRPTSPCAWQLSASQLLAHSGVESNSLQKVWPPCWNCKADSVQFTWKSCHEVQGRSPQSCCRIPTSLSKGIKSRPSTIITQPGTPSGSLSCVSELASTLNLQSDPPKKLPSPLCRRQSSLIGPTRSPWPMSLSPSGKFGQGPLMLKE